MHNKSTRLSKVNKKLSYFLFNINVFINNQLNLLTGKEIVSIYNLIHLF